MNKNFDIKKLSLAEWIELTQQKGEKPTIPITLHTTSGSMTPFIRMNEDSVIVVPCGPEEVRVGDVVLIKSQHSVAGVLLHRLYRIKGEKLVTLGDRMKKTDKESDCSQLLGRAVSVTGPGKNIDCDCRWRKIQGKLIVKTYHLRPITFFVCRAFGKLFSIFNQRYGKN